MSRYKKAGITEMLRSRLRGDSGKPHKVSPEQLLEAIEAVKPLFRDKRLMPNLLRACVENPGVWGQCYSFPDDKYLWRMKATEDETKRN